MKHATLIWLVVTMMASEIAASSVDAPRHQQRIGGQVNAASQQPKPSSWLLDIQTRLDRRFDKNLREERLKEAGVSQTGAADFIDGSRDPELLLPWELHRFLLSTAFYGDGSVAAAWRRRFESATPSLGISNDFWTKLRDVSLDYFRDQETIATLSEQMRTSSKKRGSELPATIAAVERSQCYQRMAALERANAIFGHEWFAKFLYLSVAPNLKVSAVHSISAERHLFISRGCR